MGNLVITGDPPVLDPYHSPPTSSPGLQSDIQKVENLPPADLQVNIFQKGAKSNALTRTF